MKTKKGKYYISKDFRRHSYDERIVKKRRFVCTEGKFNKYWNCWVEGNKFCSEWGPIGSWEKRKPRPLHSEAAARKHMENTIKRKTKQKEPGNSHGTYKEIFDLTENKIKHILSDWLKNDGWSVEVHWRKSKGADLIATKNNRKWIIEAVGLRTKQLAKIRSFNSVLGEILQKMDDSKGKYSIALPDQEQYKNLWKSLPKKVKDKNGITALFIDKLGNVTECSD